MNLYPKNGKEPVVPQERTDLINRVKPGRKNGGLCFLMTGKYEIWKEVKTYDDNGDMVERDWVRLAIFNPFTGQVWNGYR